MPHQTSAALNERFAIHDHVRFQDGPNNLVRCVVQTAHATATVYTHGAHITDWTAAGQKPGIYVSPASPLDETHAIRGGVPIIFPWFGPYSGTKVEGMDYPLHGFARISEWTVESTHFGPDGDVTLVFSLGPNDLARAYGYGDFRCVVTYVLGATLSMTLEVTNNSGEPFTFEEGFHTYFAVGHPRDTTVAGLQGTTFLDKRDDFKAKSLETPLLHFTRDVDQVHIHTASPLTIHDAAWQRDIAVDKSGSSATVCWNPWSVLTPTFKDLAPDSWEHFVCVEAVNCMEDKATVAPGATHTLNCTVSYTAA